MADDNNILGNLAENLGENLKETLENKVDPSKVFSEGNLKKKRSAFWTCLIAALILVLLAAAVSIYANAIKVDTFETQLLEKVDYQKLGTDELSIRSFARETIFYLTGAQDTWNPQIVIGGYPASSFIPQSFRDHMATVKGWFGSATAIMLAGLGIVVVLLGRALIGTKGSKKGSFSIGGYYIGAAIPIVLIGGVGLWAYFNFDSMWETIHKLFIPDGIFSNTEQIMDLFPSDLFAAYLTPIATMFGILVAVILVLPLLFKPLSLLLTNLFGKKSSSSSKKSSITRTSSTTAGSVSRSVSAHKTTTKSGTSSTAKKTTTAKKPSTAKRATASKSTSTAKKTSSTSKTSSKK